MPGTLSPHPHYHHTASLRPPQETTWGSLQSTSGKKMCSRSWDDNHNIEASLDHIISQEQLKIHFKGQQRMVQWILNRVLGTGRVTQQFRVFLLFQMTQVQFPVHISGGSLNFTTYNFSSNRCDALSWPLSITAYTHMDTHHIHVPINKNKTNILFNFKCCCISPFRSL